MKNLSFSPAFKTAVLRVYILMLRHHYPSIPFVRLAMKRHHYPLIPYASCSGKSRFDLVYILYILTVSTLLPFTLYTREL